LVGAHVNGSHAIAHGDVLACLKELPDNSFDALLCDPPYGLSFMGKKWDYDVPSVEVWREAYRVLKPGAALLAFGGSRTFHRIAVNIEDAGFHLRDCLSWMYGKGFPKSLNVGKALDAVAGATRPVVGSQVLRGTAAMSCEEKGGTYSAGNVSRGFPPKTIDVTGPATELAQQWDGYGTALKPGWEPIILARKPLEGTVANNVTKWGCGALAIDACRLEGEQEWTQEEWTAKGASRPTKNAYGEHKGSNTELPAGRWPTNVALTHTEDCLETPHGEGCVGDCPIYLLNRQSGIRKSGIAVTRNGGGNAGGSVFTNRESKAKPDSGYTDSGGPARFFYCAKVSTKERELGCEALPKRSAGEATDREDGSAGLSSPRAGAGRGDGARNHHPTLKPIALTKWLATLIKPPTEGATLLIPYSGAGSEIIGALQADWPLVFGIEGEAEYIEIANARISAWDK
jgi:hypothetical protein